MNKLVDGYKIYLERMVWISWEKKLRELTVEEYLIAAEAFQKYYPDIEFDLNKNLLEMYKEAVWKEKDYYGKWSNYTGEWGMYYEEKMNFYKNRREALEKRLNIK